MPTNARQFQTELLHDAKLFVEGNQRDFRDKLLLEALNLISITWPVDTGYSRGGNLPFVGNPEVEVPPEGSTSGGRFGDPADAAVLQQAEFLLRQAGAFETVGVATNVIYAPALEAGHSLQFSHMYKLAAQALETSVETVR